MKSRIAVARALAVESDVMLMDEPLGPLNNLTKVDILKFIANCDFELKNGSGFYLQGLIAGASYGYLKMQYTSILTLAHTKIVLMIVGVVGIQKNRVFASLYFRKT